MPNKGLSKKRSHLGLLFLLMALIIVPSIGLVAGNIVGILLGTGLFVIIALVIATVLKKGKKKERKSFRTEDRKLVVKMQNQKCAMCKHNAGVWDIDHIDGNRSNNHISNCQALCPNCHAKKTRGMIIVETSKSIRKFPSRSIVIILCCSILIVSFYFLAVRT